MPETQPCAACKRPLSRYNPDMLCSSCLRAARYGTDGAETPADGGGLTPVWLWDSPPMRRALAGLDLAAMMVIFRAATGLSQLELAQLLGWSQSTVSLIEKGQRDTLFDIRELLRFARTVVMPGEALLPAILGRPDAALRDVSLASAELADTWMVEDAGLDVDRRTFGGLVAGAAAAVILPSAAVPAQATAAHARYLQACVDSLYARDQAVGGAALLRQALMHWQYARRMLGESSYTEPIERQLLAITSELAICTGWLAFDGGNVPLARYLYAEAHLAAGHAGNPVVAAHALEKWSMLCSYLARTAGAANERRSFAREGLRLALQAADQARHEPVPRLHALIAMRHANAASLLGDEAAFRSAITRARRELDRGTRADDPEWIQFVDETEITGLEAMGVLNLGKPGRGETLYRTVLDGNLTRRNRTYYGALLSGALLQQHAREHAIAEGMSVLPALADGVTSVRTLNELRPLRAVDGPHTEERAAFCEQFDAVARSMAS